MKVLFRAQVANICSLAEKFIKKLIEIDGRFYCIGFESLLDGEYTIIDEDGNCFCCIYDTRAIHFEDMIDSDKNKIFASLSEDRKGGDILEYEDVNGTVYIDIFTYSVKADTNQGYLMPHMFINSKVIGIQK